MKSGNIPYLCGGILFTLIIQARKHRTKARNKLGGGSDGLSDKDVMSGLVFAVTGEHAAADCGNSFRKTTNMFKTCQNYGSTYIPFREEPVIASFNTLYEHNNPDLLCRMSGFVEKYIPETKTEWLVKSLMEVILEDIDIAACTTFQITDDTALRKDEFDNISQVSLPIFLISVLHFILNERKDNTLGRATFEAWHSHGASKSSWKFISNVGLSIKRRIVVNNRSANKDTEEVKASNDKETDDDMLVIPFVSRETDLDNLQYSSDDKTLLKEFTEDYDDIMIELMGDNYADSMIDMSLPEKITVLFEEKWKTKADRFSDPFLKSFVYGLLGELNKLSNSFLSCSGNVVSMRITRKRIRNLYVKLHPEGFSASSPYDAFIDDWNEGELY